MKHPIRFAKTLVWLNIPVYFGIGLAAVFAPRWLAAQLDIALQSSTAVCDFSAMYGGLSCAAGVTMVAGVRQPVWLRPTLAFVGLFAAELAFGRAYAWWTNGMPDTLILVSLAAELATVALATWGFRALADVPGPGPEGPAGKLQVAHS